jgi:hypothetical protein
VEARVMNTKPFASDHYSSRRAVIVRSNTNSATLDARRLPEPIAKAVHPTIECARECSSHRGVCATRVGACEVVRCRP